MLEHKKKTDKLNLAGKKKTREVAMPSLMYNNSQSSLRCAGHVARMEKDSSFKILTGKPTGKRPLGIPRRRWEDNIGMNLK